MDIGVELCNVQVSSVITLLKSCNWILPREFHSAEILHMCPSGNFGLLCGCLSVTGILWCSCALMALEAVIKSGWIRRDGKHLWLFRCFWGTQKACSKSNGLLSCSVILYFLLCLWWQLYRSLPSVCAFVWAEERSELCHQGRAFACAKPCLLVWGKIKGWYKSWGYKEYWHYICHSNALEFERSRVFSFFF